MAMRRMIDTLFMNSLARGWAEEQAQREQMAQAAVTAGQMGQQQFDRQAQLAEQFGGVAADTGRELTDVQAPEAMMPRAQLGYERSLGTQEALRRKAAAAQILEAIKQRAVTDRELMKGQFGLEETRMREAGEQSRWAGEAPLRGAEIGERQARAGYYRRMPTERGAGAAKLPPQVKMAFDAVNMAIKEASSLEKTATGAWNAAAGMAARDRLSKAWQAFITLAQTQLPPEQAQAAIQSLTPYIQSLGQGGGGATPMPGSIIPQQAPQPGAPADIEPINSYEDYLRSRGGG